MKLLLAHAYFIHEDHVEQQVMRPYPPLGILYVSSFLEQNNIDHVVFDGTFLNRNNFFEQVEKLEPDFIAFYVNFLTRINVLQLIKKLKSEGKNIQFILGGPDIRYNIDEYLKHGSDFLIFGEGEQSLVDLIIALKKGETLKTIPGIAFKNSNGENFVSNERMHIASLDQLPLPNRKRIDFKKYLQSWKKVHGYNSITINTQRGCPYTCNWCSHAVYGDTYRRRSPSSVVNELIALNETYSPDSYWFVDDVFTMSRTWLEDFKNELIRKEIKITYECITRADRLDFGTIQLLKDTGCSMIWIGAESGSQKIIDLMDRRVEVNVVREMIKIAHQAGIQTGTFIMLGYPGENLSDIHETIKHLKAANPDHFTINLAYPIKGTRLFEQIKDDFILPGDWASTPDRDLDFKRTYSQAFYPWAIRMVYNDVFAYQSFMKGQPIKSGWFKIKALVSSLMLQFYRF